MGSGVASEAARRCLIEVLAFEWTRGRAHRGIRRALLASASVAEGSYGALVAVIQRFRTESGPVVA